MKEFSKNIKQRLFPKHKKAVDREIDMLNLKTVYYVSLVECIIQSVSLIVFIISKLSHSENIFNPNSLGSIINVASSIVLCIFGFIFSR